MSDEGYAGKRGAKASFVRKSFTATGSVTTTTATASDDSTCATCGCPVRMESFVSRSDAGEVLKCVVRCEGRLPTPKRPGQKKCPPVVQIIEEVSTVPAVPQELKDRYHALPSDARRRVAQVDINPSTVQKAMSKSGCSMKSRRIIEVEHAIVDEERKLSTAEAEEPPVATEGEEFRKWEEVNRNRPVDEAPTVEEEQLTDEEWETMEAEEEPAVRVPAPELDSSTWRKQFGITSADLAASFLSAAVDASKFQEQLLKLIGEAKPPTKWQYADRLERLLGDMRRDIGADMTDELLRLVCKSVKA